jgi:aspartyl-tRNA(Asn)/glutamyl-tRNA(Gln) amidotransferase subunit A
MDLEPRLSAGSAQGVEMSGEPALMSLVSVAKAIAGKKFSSREVTQSCLDRIAQWQPRVNAFMAVEADEALAAADAADADLAKGRNSGVLHGVPLAHKDMYYDAGKVVTCGSKIRRDYVATTTSTALQRLKNAGTIRLGSLQMVEFAYGPTGHNVHYGAVRNPGRRSITGGSSSGSGSAVAARPASRAGLRYRRVDPPPRRDLRDHRAQGDLRPREPRRRDALSQSLDTVGRSHRRSKTVRC